MRTGRTRAAGTLFAFAVAANLLLLGYYKYANFLLGTWGSLTRPEKGVGDAEEIVNFSDIFKRLTRTPGRKSAPFSIAVVGDRSCQHFLAKSQPGPSDFVCSPVPPQSPVQVGAF